MDNPRKGGRDPFYAELDRRSRTSRLQSLGERADRICEERKGGVMDKQLARDQMEFHRMQFQWWLASATNGHALSRDLWRGVESDPDSRPFTDQEKINRAMETAQRHMTMFRDASEALTESREVER